MKKRGMPGLFPLFLALFLAFCACDSSTTDPGSSGSKNGALYYAEGNAGEWVIVGLGDPASISDNRAAFAPKSGYWYVIGIGSETNAGEEPVSMGTITIQADGSRLTFTPFADMGFPSASFTGTLGQGYLIMDSIPGKNYSGFRVDEGSSYNFKSSDDPWGTGGGLPSIPGAPDFGDDGGGDTPSGGANLNLGKFVSDVIIINNPSVKTAYEGFPVDLTGLTVEIHYSNGDKATKTSANANDFIIDPPVYTTANGVHTLKYAAEYNNQYALASSPSRREFRAPINNASQGSFFYEMINPEWILEATGAANMEYFEGIDSYDFSGVSIKALYSNGEKTINPTSVYKTSLDKSYSPDDAALNVYIGRRPALIPINFKKVYPLKDIQLEGSPDFSAHILYDDPRFISGEKEKHWLSKYNNVSLKLLYTGTSATKSIKLLKAIENELVECKFPENFIEKDPKITFTYSGENKDYTVTSVVPVYNKLVKITVESTVGDILLKGQGPLYPDDEESFLRQVKIKAFYQLSSNKNNIVVRDNILVYPPMPQNAYIDPTLINADPIKTNVNRSTDGGILNEANSNAYDKKKKLVKAKVTFSSKSVGSDEATEKSATIEVGVTGYY
jgi:hypothetical protein